MDEIYTYLVKSEYVDMEAVKEVFDEKGNWVPYDEDNGDGNVTFFFKDGKYIKDARYYGLKQKVLNIMDKPKTRDIYSKDYLYTVFMDYNSDAARKFMVRQFNITNRTYRKVSRETFGNKIWILKGVMSNSGKDIFIMETYDQYLDFFKKKQILDRWVLAEYINNPLLVFDRKFHIRVYFLATSEKEYFYQTNGFVITAQEPYIRANYLDKKIHDTHQTTSIPGLFMPDGFDIYSSDKVQYIRDQIAELCYHIAKMSYVLKCYEGDPFCFEIFGIDIMVLDNFKIKLIEINIKASWLKLYDVTKNFMRGIMESVLDPRFPPLNKVLDTKYFTKIDVTKPIVIAQLKSIQGGTDKSSISDKSSITDKYTITDGEETWYTYNIYTDTDLDVVVDRLFRERGNWKRVYDQNATFLYTYIKNDMNLQKKSWLYKSYITNSILRNDNLFINKSALYNILKKYDPDIADKYMVKQYDVNYNNYRTIISQSEFEHGKIWILKPVFGWSGKGIVVFKEYDEYVRYLDTDKKRNAQSPHKVLAKKLWVLAKYIDNPLLYKGKKFHLRVPFLYYDYEGYVGKTFSIITAAADYKQGDYNNKDVHDTHVANAVKGILFPRDFDEVFGTELRKKIFKSILELFHYVTNITKSGEQFGCYDTTVKCYSIYGADVLITDDYEIKLLEINNSAGFTGFVDEIFSAELSYIIDKELPPKNRIENNNFFVNVTNLQIGFSRVKNMHMYTNGAKNMHMYTNSSKNMYMYTDDNGKQWYTYNVFTDIGIDDYIDQLFKARGNWKRVRDSNCTFVYSYVRKDIELQKKAWKYSAYIENNVKRFSTVFANKSKLYKIFKDYDIEIANRYMTKQFDIKTGGQMVSEAEFNRGKIWILKPVLGYAGKGIRIFRDYAEFVDYVESNEGEWVLAEYIDRPMLYLKRKFHFRVPYIFFNGQGYVARKFVIVTAGEEYQNDDYDNKMIHDTHLANSIKNLIFPKDFDSGTLFDQILGLFYYVTQAILNVDSKAYGCYDRVEKCYTVFGADVMVTEDGKVKLLEINNGAVLDALIQEVVAGEIYTVIDGLLEPENIVDNDFFVNVTNYDTAARINYQKYIKYKNKYIKGGNNNDNDNDNDNDNEASVSYPLYKKYNEMDRQIFLDLVDEFKPKIVHKVPDKMYRYRLHKYKGTYWLIEEDWGKNEKLNSITDYFTEECRIKCRFGNKESPIEYWEKHKDSIMGLSNYDKMNIRDYIYKHTKLCNNFRISVSLTILEMFKAKKWLDISAGWGDRLISAIAYDVELYCAVDPNDCLYPKYDEIINTLALPEKRKNFIVLHSGFENAILPDTKFDLVFSSPPFFDLEIYSQAESDSVVKYGDVNYWYDKFLIFSLKKAHEYLQVGGHMVLYMGEGIGTTYIKNMIEDMNKIMKYLGVIYYYYPNKNIPRSLYVWQKNRAS